MIQCTCLVQSGQISSKTKDALRGKLSTFTHDAFGNSARINWIEIPENSGFTAGKPSTSSVVAIQSDAALKQPHRIALLTKLCDLWQGTTGCGPDDVVGVISDPTN